MSSRVIVQLATPSASPSEGPPAPTERTCRWLDDIQQLFLQNAADLGGHPFESLVEPTQIFSQSLTQLPLTPSNTFHRDKPLFSILLDHNTAHQTEAEAEETTLHPADSASNHPNTKMSNLSAADQARLGRTGDYESDFSVSSKISAGGTDHAQYRLLLRQCGIVPHDPEEELPQMMTQYVDKFQAQEVSGAS